MELNRQKDRGTGHDNGDHNLCRISVLKNPWHPHRGHIQLHPQLQNKTNQIKMKTTVTEFHHDHSIKLIYYNSLQGKESTKICLTPKGLLYGSVTGNTQPVPKRHRSQPHQHPSFLRLLFLQFLRLQLTCENPFAI